MKVFYFTMMSSGKIRVSVVYTYREVMEWDGRENEALMGEKSRTAINYTWTGLGSNRNSNLKVSA
jgi:hypothetical protein